MNNISDNGQDGTGEEEEDQSTVRVVEIFIRLKDGRSTATMIVRIVKVVGVTY